MSFQRALTRGVVTVEVAICEEADGRSEAPAPEVWLQQRLVAAGDALEVLLDELEGGGRRFISPVEPTFQQGPSQRERVDWDVYSCTLEVVCAPPFAPEALAEVARRVAAIVFGAEDGVVTDPGDFLDETTDPGSYRGRETKVSRPARRVTDDAATPLGVPAIAAESETPLEVTAVERRPEEVPTRPEGVLSIKRPR